MNAVDQRAQGIDLFAGNGEMSRLMRAHDWSATPLGPVEGWPQSLKTAVRIILGSRYPMFIWWGRELTNLYNDGYRPMLGKRHPHALGKSASVIWSEIWDTIGPQTDAVLYEGRATWNEERLLVLERNGYPEEAYFTFSYSPVPTDDGGIGGIFCALTEDTQRVLSQRRMRTLRELAATTTGARTVEQAAEAAPDTLAQNPHDLPFTFLYLLDDEGKVARLAGTTGLVEGSPACPPAIELLSSDGQPALWPLSRVVATSQAESVEGLVARFGPLRCGVWPEPPHSAIVLPLKQAGQDRLTGFLVAGVSPRREFDDDYRGFMEMLAGHVATAIANARAYEEERRRAEALAELDRAKTAFFSNVSHEFRTPLTLMLGPVEDMLAKPAEQVPPDNRHLLEVVHRNGLRLQKLVNMLLDFSRIEAGRVQACYEPVDLAALTADLASTFRSACEKAGLVLRVDCPPLPEPVYVDREMWEKIVLNLLSNAFKFTLKGRIEVSLRRVDGHAELAVRDTGMGIPVVEMPKLFERFHRVEGSRGRTQEGSGIGLALVRELVRLHGGEVRAESEFGKGSVFTVSLPLGNTHLPAERISATRTLASTALGAAPYIEEALRWLPGSSETGIGQPVPLDGSDGDTRAATVAAGKRSHVLLADDNADMRDYVRRLLADRYDVTTVADGQAAGVAVQEAVPDLILADVMMPGLDGFGLLRQLRADPRTREVPVILLSARAGEESRVEGMEAGADDYLIKPFSARELLARVQGHLELAKLRRESQQALRQSEERFRSLCACSPVGIFTTDTLGHCTYTNPRCQAICGFTFEEALGEGWASLVHPDDRKRVFEAWSEAARAGREYAEEFRWQHRDGAVRWSRLRSAPMLSHEGRLLGHVGTVEDISEQKRLERRRSARLAVTQVMAEAATLKEAAPRILQAVCDGLGWDMGAFWMVDRQANVLRCQELWHTASVRAEAFVECCQQRTFDPGIGLPGRVWSSGRPAWIPDVAEDTNFPRASIAVKEGLHGAFGAPVLSGPECLGVIEFFSREIREPDSDLLEMMATIGSQIGQFIERKSADDALRRLAAIVESSDDAIISKNLDGIIVSWNKGAERLYGYTAEEIVGQPLAILVPPDHSDELPAIVERLKRGERIEHYETVRVRKGGSRLDVSLTISPVKNAQGRIIGASKIARDITRQKHVQQTTRFLADASAALAELTDYESTLQRVASLAVPQFADWCAVDMQQPDGSVRRLAVTHSDPAKVRLAHELFLRFPPLPTDAHGVMAVLRTGEPEWLAAIPDSLLIASAQDEEHLRIIRDLGLKSSICVPLRSRAKILGVLTFVTAESGRVYDADDLRAAEDLAARAAIAIENARLLAALKEADRRKDEFLAMLAHELRNPLAPLRNAAHLLQQPGLDQPFVGRTGEMVGRQVQQLGRLVDDLLDLSRIARGKMQLRKETVDLGRVIHRAAEVSRPLMEAKQHEFHVSLPTPPVSLVADPTRLEQIVTNLLNNAARYTPEKGRIWLTATKEGNEATVRVRDTGIGIPPEMLSRIFGLFAQVERQQERTEGGLGIGLSLVKSLTEMHGGRVEAHSAGPGQGSEFVVRWPLPTEEGPRIALRPPEKAAATEQAMRVLLVDDNVDAAESLAMLLRLWGHEVAVAHNGPEALRAAGAQRPQVALLDIGLPGMDGYELARRLRWQPGLGQAVLVALTGWGQEEDRRRSKEAGFDHHLVKPVDLSDLQDLLALAQPQGTGP